MVIRVGAECEGGRGCNVGMGDDGLVCMLTAVLLRLFRGGQSGTALVVEFRKGKFSFKFSRLSLASQSLGLM